MKFKPNYIIIPAITIAIQLIGRLFWHDTMQWYNALRLPDLTPPGWVFGIVWPTIYLLTTVSVLIVWNTMRHTNKFWNIIAFFAMNAVLNAMWSFVFAYNRAIEPAVLVCGLIAATVGMLIGLMWKTNKLAASLLVPYFVWTCFATYLNVAIAQLN